MGFSDNIFELMLVLLSTLVITREAVFDALHAIDASEERTQKSISVISLRYFPSSAFFITLLFLRLFIVGSQKQKRKSLMSPNLLSKTKHFSFQSVVYQSIVCRFSDIIY